MALFKQRFSRARPMKKILIIEDDSVTARVYSSLLERHDFQVEIVPTVRKALDRLAEFQPEGALLDLMLPESNGLEFLKAVRALDGFKDIPVIVYTNLYVPGMTEKAKEAGATKVFDKATLTPKSLVDAFRSSTTPPRAEAA